MERERIIRALKICDFNDEGVACKKCPIKDDGFNGAWSDEDGSCYQHLMREAAELLSEQPDTTSDLISRQEAIDAAALSAAEWDGMYVQDINERIRKALEKLPPAQPEPSIPLSWIEKYIEWLKSLDNEFARLAAAHISVMVKKWRSEQDE